MRTTMLTALVLAGLVLSAPAQKIVVRGSNTFGEELGPRLVQEFLQKRPGWEIVLETPGSGAGIVSLLDGTCDIAPSSRSLSEDELRLATSRRLQFRNHSIGYYGVAVIVAKDHPVKALTDRQVRELFTGRITNWRDVGGADAPVVPYIRDAVSGTHLGFQELAMDRQPYAASARTCRSDAEMIAAVNGDPNGIGYIGMTLAARAPVQALKINGISPTVLAVSDDLYPYARQLRLFTVRGQETAEALAFIKFVRSTQGQNILDDMGFVRRFHRKLTFGAEVP